MPLLDARMPLRSAFLSLLELYVHFSALVVHVTCGKVRFLDYTVTVLETDTRSCCLH